MNEKPVPRDWNWRAALQELRDQHTDPAEQAEHLERYIVTLEYAVDALLANEAFSETRARTVLRTVHYQVSKPCPECHGHGWDPLSDNSDPIRCITCGGNGYLRTPI